MLHKSRSLQILAVVYCTTVFAFADTIVLKSGQKIVGDVLKTQKDSLFVDIGFDVIQVPVDSIRERVEETKQPVEQEISDGSLLRTADLPERTVKELVNRFSEGVVLVQTSDGLGSGFVISSEGHCVTNYHVVEGQTRIAVTIFHRTEQGEFKRIAVRDVVTNELVHTETVSNASQWVFANAESGRSYRIYVTAVTDGGVAGH